MIFNAEFRRNLWLEFSTFRLIGMPVVLSLIIYIGSQTKDFWAEIITSITLTLMAGIGALWGTFKAAGAMSEEVKEKTWDFQRMSSLGAWDLTIGKLFGTTSYMWYGILLLTPVFIISYSNMVHFEQISIARNVNLPSLPYCLFLIFSGCLLAQSIAMLLSMQDVTYKVMRNKMGTFGYQIIALIIASSVVLPGGIDFIKEAANLSDRTWHGIAMQAQTFQCLSILFFLFWAIVGIYRTLRQELQFKSTPVYWAAFLITISIYYTGVIPSNIGGGSVADILSAAKFGIALMIMLAATYGMFYIEAKNIVRYRKLLIFIREKKVKPLLENLPLWMVSFAFAFICYMLLLGNMPDSIPARYTENSFAFLTAIMLFVTRDLIVGHYLFFAKKNKRANMTFVLYMLLVYAILPAVFRVTSSEAVLAMFFPRPDVNLFQAVVPVGLQILVALYFLRKRWKNIQIRNESGASDGT